MTTTDPRETPQTREEKLAATSTMYSTADMKATDGVTSYFTKEIDKDQAAERLALPALWETFSYDRTVENFDAYRDAYLAVNGSFPYDHLRTMVRGQHTHGWVIDDTQDYTYCQECGEPKEES